MICCTLLEPRGEPPTGRVRGFVKREPPPCDHLDDSARHEARGALSIRDDTDLMDVPTNAIIINIVGA